MGLLHLAPCQTTASPFLRRTTVKPTTDLPIEAQYRFRYIVAGMARVRHDHWQLTPEGRSLHDAAVAWPLARVRWN